MIIEENGYCGDGFMIMIQAQLEEGEKMMFFGKLTNDGARQIRNALDAILNAREIQDKQRGNK